ncbi:endonuclease V isoform X2 [Solanum lycopersicum]|uniref:endonuclease V isoform X2 n=1 Tax=Solanum lycopersicum TaxID=4081 RepID=UPI000532BAF0|nr:endonuclease V isoform X2 [Solanum lycopersicum]
MNDAKEASSSISNFSNEFQSSQQMDWLRVQDSLKGKLITEDDFKWRLPTREKEGSCEILKYVGGVDLSFSKDDSSIACGTLVVLDLTTQKVVYEDSSIVRLHIPYLPGFLAFREAPVLLELLDKMKNNAHCFYPQLLMVDGNGLLHPRGFGLACHIGVLADLPTVGVGKNAMRSSEGSLKPIFISVGHRISLASAIAIVRMTCKFRVPEPIRQADIRSRERLRNNQ